MSPFLGIRGKIYEKYIFKILKGQSLDRILLLKYSRMPPIILKLNRLIFKSQAEKGVFCEIIILSKSANLGIL